MLQRYVSKTLLAIFDFSSGSEDFFVRSRRFILFLLFFYQKTFSVTYEAWSNISKITCLFLPTQPQKKTKYILSLLHQTHFLSTSSFKEMEKTI